MKRKETLLGKLNPDRVSVDPSLPSAELPRWQKILFLVAALGGVLFVAYSLLGFFFAPWLLKKQLVAQVEQQTELKAELREVGFNPYTLTARLSGLRLESVEGNPLFTCEQLQVNLQSVTLFRKGLVLRKLAVVEPTLYLERDASGGVNLLEPFPMVPDGTAKPESGGDPSIPLIALKSLSVEGGELSLRDAVPDAVFETTIEPIEFNLDSFSTHPGKEGAFTLTASGANGYRFRFEGAVQVSPIRLAGRLELDELSVHDYHPYFGPLVNFELETATVGTSFDLLFELEPKRPRLEIRNGRLELREAYLRNESKEERFFSLPLFVVEGAGLNLSDRVVNIESVVVEGGNVLMIQERDKRINLVQLLQLQKDFIAEPVKMEGTEASALVPSPSPPWEYRVGRFQVNDFKVYAEDQSTTSPARYELLAESFLLREISSDAGAETRIDGRFQIGESGRITLEGSGAPQPVAVRLAVMGSEVPVSLVEPYLDRVLTIDIEGGRVAYEGEVEVSREEDDWRIRVGGNGFIDDLETLHEAFPEGRLRMTRMGLSEFHFHSEGPRFSAGEVALTGLRATYFRFSDGRWLSPFRETREEPATKTAASEEEPTAATAGGLPDVSVEMVVLEQGELNFIDRSVNPAFRGILNGLSGKIENLTNLEGEETRFELSGDLNDLGKWNVTGGGTLLNYREDLAFDFELEPSSLTLLNSYSEKYLGRRIDRGKLSLELDYRLESFELSGANRIVIDQLQLGEAVPTEDKVIEFPLGLALAALQDPNGVMDLNVNIAGRLDDPTFRLGGVLTKAILNLLSKAATAPFTLLASLAGTNRELSYLQFGPGEAELGEESRERLDALGKALLQRPNLTLEYAGSTDSNLDRRAIKEAELETILRDLQERDRSAPGGEFSGSDTRYRELLAYAITVMEDTVTVYPDWSDSVASEKGPRAETGASGGEFSDEVVLSEAGVAETLEEETDVELELEIAEVRRAGGGFTGLFGLGGQNRTDSPQTIRVSGKTPTDSPAVESGAPPRQPDPVSMEFPEELPPLEILEEQILSRMELEDSALAGLEARRERAVRNYLVEIRGIPEDRLYLVNSAGNPKEGDLARVNFSLGNR